MALARLMQTLALTVLTYFTKVAETRRSHSGAPESQALWPPLVLGSPPGNVLSSPGVFVGAEDLDALSQVFDANSRQDSTAIGRWKDIAMRNQLQRSRDEDLDVLTQHVLDESRKQDTVDRWKDAVMRDHLQARSRDEDSGILSRIFKPRRRQDTVGGWKDIAMRNHLQRRRDAELDTLSDIFDARQRRETVGGWKDIAMQDQLQLKDQMLSAAAAESTAKELLTDAAIEGLHEQEKQDMEQKAKLMDDNEKLHSMVEAKDDEIMQLRTKMLPPPPPVESLSPSTPSTSKTTGDISKEDHEASPQSDRISSSLVYPSLQSPESLETMIHNIVLVVILLSTSLIGLAVGMRWAYQRQEQRASVHESVRTVCMRHANHV